MRRSHRVVVEGVLAGLAGAAAVALWFFVHDVLSGVPLRTPALLGAALLQGSRYPSEVTITAGLVLGYTAVHVVAFVLYGWAAAGLLALSDREPRVLYGVFMLFCCQQFVVVTVVATMAAWVLEPIGWSSFVCANLVATAAMLAVFGRRHHLAFWTPRIEEPVDRVPVAPTTASATRPLLRAVPRETPARRDRPAA